MQGSYIYKVCLFLLALEHALESNLNVQSSSELKEPFSIFFIYLNLNQYLIEILFSLQLVKFHILQYQSIIIIHDAQVILVVLLGIVYSISLYYYIQMRQTDSQTQQDDNLNVAPIISDQKLSQLKHKIISTLSGLATLGHYQYNETQINNKNKSIAISIILYILMPCLIILPSSIITQYKFHALAVLISTVINPLICFICDIILNKPKVFHKYLCIAVYSYLWSVHFFISRQLAIYYIISTSSYAAIMVLSIISIFTSASTIGFAPVRQFSASTLHYTQIGVHSTLYCRFYIQFPILLTEAALYYSIQTGIQFIPIIILQYVASLSFVLWFFGWVSSLFNNIMFISHNLINCLVFGQHLSHSGNNFRGTNIWWICCISTFMNISCIGLNIALVQTMRVRGQLKAKIVQSQHVLIVCLATISSLATSLIYYLSYRFSKQNKSLLRLNKFDFTQTEGQNLIGKRKKYKQHLFIGHRNIVMIIVNIAVPLIISLLTVFVFAEYYDGYNAGKKYDRQTNFKAQKIATIVLLAVNTSFYLILILFKQITRVRSKIGCSLNPGCFQYFHVQIQRDMVIKLILKITGALSVMALVLRIQNLQVFSYYILQKTPLSPQPHPYVQFFTTSILIPILVYRSYKRSQIFSHFFHITVIVALILTIIDSTLYFYQSIFVVLAFPNFPQNPLRLLLLSPFLTPKKLRHKSQNLYIVGYMFTNFFTLIIYVASLGTLQFTSLFGLPMYWCVLPSINCQSSTIQQRKIHPAQIKSDHKATISDFQMTNQMFDIHKPKLNRNTPEHSLYQKIIQQIPFYIFRNKRPGYYLLRISKYIILVEIIMDFYGIFQSVCFAGLQTQQVTTCHAKQGQTIDRIIQNTWGNKQLRKNQQACGDALKAVIHEQHCLRKSKFTTQNQIQLTGIIESSQFYLIFKKCLIRSLIYYYNKFLKANPKHQLTKQQIKQAELLYQQLQNKQVRQKIDEIFPYSFFSETQQFVFQAKYKQFSSSKIVGKKKLPPIKKEDKIKKQNIIDDFADLVGNTSDIIQNIAIQENKDKKVDIDVEEQAPKNNLISNGQEKKQLSNLHMAIIMSAYFAILGKFNYLNIQRLYKIMKKDSSLELQLEFDKSQDLIINSIGSALKISIGKQLLAEQTIQYDDFKSYDKNQYLGTLQSYGFSEAIELHKQQIWTVSYHQMKKTLIVKRLARQETQLCMLSLQTNAVQAVWNNLRFQLLFAGNDNDQRYSIQTHPYLLRNLLVEGCEEPYGYAGFYSNQYLNL